MNPLSYQDITIKAKINNLEEIEQKLTDLKATFVGVDIQEDHYYQVAVGKLKWRKGTIENLITHYDRKVVSGMEQTIVYRYDLNPTEQAIEELKQSHPEIAIIKKQRRIYWMNNVKIHLDITAASELFLEIEAIDRSNTVSTKTLLQQCREVQNLLGISDRHLIRTGYLTEPRE